MIKLERSKSIESERDQDPENLEPIVFKCKLCGCYIKKIEETKSYVFQAINKEIVDGTKKICSYCYRLKEYRGLE